MRDARLIIFDCDGVLVDTEPVTNRVLARCVSDAGWDIDDAYSVAHFKGRNLSEILGEVEAHLGRPAPALLDTYRARMFEAFEASPIPAIDGVHELLDALDTLASTDPARAPHRCVATNAPMNKMRLTLGGSGLIDRFAHRDHPERATMFSAYEVNAWKPDPGLFLHAAATMGHQPQDCMVIEDSVSGVHAARNAGMRVIGLASLTPAQVLLDAGATRVIGSHRELLGELTQKA